MITKERLEELIKQGAIIYKLTHNNRIDCRRLRSKMKIVDNSLYFNYKDPHLYSNLKWCYSALYRLFENKEDAEWHRDFGCIERTERLVLPTWEEVSRDLENAPVGNYVIKSSDGWSLEYVKYNETFIGLYSEYAWSEWEATKENYTLACRKCKELFFGLGEKK